MVAFGEGATVLQDVGGRGYSVASAINNSGQSVGISEIAGRGGAEAVLWSASGKATVLQDVGGEDGSVPQAINDAGQSVGSSLTASGADAVLWSRSGKGTVLQDAGDHGDSFAVAINDAGWSVGYSYTASLPTSSTEGVLWSPSGKATDLDALLGPGWSRTEAVGINDSGDIIGHGEYHGEFSGFLLTPASSSILPATGVPELSTWAMLLAGFAGLSFAGRARMGIG